MGKGLLREKFGKAGFWLVLGMAGFRLLLYHFITSSHHRYIPLAA